MLAQNIVIEQRGSVAVATITTPLLGVSDGQEIIAELGERLRYSSVSQFVLDLKEVEFMDSGFIGSLVTFLQDLEHVRGKIVIASAQANVAFLFKVTRLDRVFLLCDSVEDAMAELQH